MMHDVFEEPVRIYIGLNFRKEVRRVAEAYAFLNDWPPEQRSAAHATALKACRAALTGEIDAETARGTFSAFARRVGILAPELDDIVAATTIYPFEGSAAG